MYPSSSSTPNPADPTQSAMFLNNYIHSPCDQSHLVVNCILFSGLAVCIILLTEALENLGCRLPRRFFAYIMAIFFLALPFAISGASLLVVDRGVITMISGFSGINSALLGIVLFLFLVLLDVHILHRRPPPEIPATRSPSPLARVSFLVFVPALMVVLITLGMLLDPNPQSNIAAHLAGFYLGLLCSPLVLLLTTPGGRHQQAWAAVLLALLLTVPIAGGMVV
ncbi:MAG: hypothetical protein ACP5C4_05670 [Methanomicrobiales archaeon]